MAQLATMKLTPRPVAFFANAPGAGDVRVTGDFSGWSKAGIRLSNDGHGLWRTMLSLKQGIYQYRLLINGNWADHEEATVRVDNPYGTQNCVLSVP
ncbi:MAG TPA: glycogen-binding domain-containing protein [Planctomycetota bacterium]|nr:glycogen-binding domain-containing protein [Planctomycetota bacterium]